MPLASSAAQNIKPPESHPEGNVEEMTKTLESVDRKQIQPTPLDTWEVQACTVLNEPDVTFLRALKMANRIQEPEKVIRNYRAALEVEEIAAASAFLYRLCRLLDEDPGVLVSEFGGAFLLETWVEEEKYLIAMILERIRCQQPAARGNESGQRSRWGDVARGRIDRKVRLSEVVHILEDLAMRYAEKADSEETVGNPRGMRQDLWKSKGIVEAADTLRKLFLA
jgi:hypothetical protein